MGFVFPLVLLGLLALAIPVIIHLFYFRRYKKVYFTNVRFLKELQEQKSHTDRLRKLLILASRLAAILLLVFAFAQPFLGKKHAQQGRANVAIYIDNSYSMGLTDGNMPMLEYAKEKAREITSAYGPSDRFALLTNDLEGAHQRWMGRDDVLAYIDDIQLSPRSKKISEIQRRQSALFGSAGSGHYESFIISDFQQHIADNAPDSNITANFVILQGQTERNLYIDTAWLFNPVQQLNASNQLFVRVRNSGNKKAENVRLTLQINGQVKSVTDVSVPPNGLAIDTLNFSVTEPGWQNAMVSFNDYPITFDDRFYLSFPVNQSNRILSIEEGIGKPFINAIFSGDSYLMFDRRDRNALDYSTFRNYQLIILNEPGSISQGMAAELGKYISGGGSVYLIPSASADLNAYNAFLGAVQAGRLEAAQERQAEVNYINTEENVFKAVFSEMPRNMDMPTVSKAYPIVSGFGATEIPLLRLNNGGPLIAAYKLGSGLLYLQGVPLDNKWSNLMTHAIFPPMVYNFGIFRSTAQPLYFTIGQDNFLEVDNPPTGQGAVMKMRNENIEFIPPMRPLANKAILSIPAELDQAGIYTLSSGDRVVLTAAFNAAPEESELVFTKKEDLQTLYSARGQRILSDSRGSLMAEVKHIREGRALWKVCVIFALAFLLLEIMLLRYWPATKV